METIQETRSRVSTLLVLLAVLISASLQPACAQPASEEYKVKAAFLFHFAQLVDWPPGALNPGNQSLSVCVFDDEPHLQELQSILDGKLVGSRMLHIRQLSKPEDAWPCNILFVSSHEGRRRAAVLKTLRGQPVLTVGESDSFLSDGGIIRFHIDQERIRFEVNAEAAEAARLKISSQLLLLATSVTPGDRTNGERP